MGGQAGVKQIRSTLNSHVVVDVECDADGGTVVQKRFDGKERFDRSWTDYQKGFGNPAGQFSSVQRI